jgi:RNA polymerase sigma factor (sigma-70 family)
MNTASDSPQPENPLLRPDELESMHRALQSLTPRQRQVLMLLGDGIRAAEIARVLHLSKNTVGFHLKRVMRKLGVRDRRNLLVYAVLLRRSAEGPTPHPPGQAT